MYKPNVKSEICSENTSECPSTELDMARKPPFHVENFVLSKILGTGVEERTAQAKDGTPNFKDKKGSLLCNSTRFMPVQFSSPHHSK